MQITCKKKKKTYPWRISIRPPGHGDWAMLRKANKVNQTHSINVRGGKNSLYMSARAETSRKTTDTGCTESPDALVCRSLARGKQYKATYGQPPFSQEELTYLGIARDWVLQSRPQQLARSSTVPFKWRVRFVPSPFVFVALLTESQRETHSTSGNVRRSNNKSPQGCRVRDRLGDEAI